MATDDLTIAWEPCAAETTMGSCWFSVRCECGSEWTADPDRESDPCDCGRVYRVRLVFERQVPAPPAASPIRAGDRVRVIANSEELARGMTPGWIGKTGTVDRVELDRMEPAAMIDLDDHPDFRGTGPKHGRFSLRALGPIDDAD